MPLSLGDSQQIWGTTTIIIIWHLPMAIIAGLAAALARELWQKQAESRFRAAWLALASITVLQILLLALALLRVNLPPLARTLGSLCALLLGWGLAAPFVSQPVKRAWLIGGLAANVALGALSSSFWQLAKSEPGWIIAVWGLFSAIGVGAGAAALALNREERSPFVVAVLSALGVGALLWTVGLDTLGQAVWLAAFAALPVGIMRWLLRDLESAERELHAFSQHALRQTQELLVLLRASTTLVAQTNVTTMLTNAVEGIALGTGADQALIALIGDDADKTIGVMSTYPPRPGKISINFPLHSHVVISQAVQSNQQTTLEPDADLAHHPLYSLMGGARAGPALVQPMTCQDRTIGIIIVGNAHNQKVLGEGAGRLLEALGAQIATAIENVRMYHRVNAQARELANLLTIREEEASQRAAILESIADGVVVTNKNEKIIMVNAAAANILGLSRSELIGMTPEDVFKLGIPLPLSVFRTSEDASVLEAFRMEFEINNRSVQASLALVQAHSGDLLGVVAVLRDVTRERQAELAKTEFISTISHELRTPLTSVKGYAELMGAGVSGPLSEAQRQFVDKIRDQAQHLTQLINEVIQYSKLERGRLVTHRQPVDMQSLVQEALEAAQQRIEADGFTVTLQVEPGAPLVYADPDYTRCIVDQLLDNALRFTPAPGQIIISIRPARPQEHPSASLPLLVSLSISDTGVGIAPDAIERVFERFYRADNPMQVTAGGLGLGLTIARALAVAQDGQLWAQSPAIERPATEPHPAPPGATFTLQLPAHVT